MLGLMGIDVRTAYGGLEALATGEVFRPNVILLDLGMPKISGYETARLIRQEPWGNEALVVALTGWGQAEDRRRSREFGFDAHLVKPVDLRSLLALLETVLAKSPDSR